MTASRADGQPAARQRDSARLTARGTVIPTAGELDQVALNTVGVDVGSATTHLMFSRVELARRAQELSSRYEVVRRSVIWRSPVTFTPYTDNDTIDAQALRAFVQQGFGQAGLRGDGLDSGVVLLTGTALQRHNARAIAASLASDFGPFVCAAAGHHLEAVLAAHGSGAVAASLRDGTMMINLDIGGGTAKLALVVHGQVRQTAAILAGSRLVAWDAGRRLVRLEPAAVRAGRQAGLDLRLGERLGEAGAQMLSSVLASTIVRQLMGAEQASLDRALLVTRRFEPPAEDWLLMLSGGVAECLEQDGTADHRDLGPALAAALRDQFAAAGLTGRLRPARNRLRATVIGVSQFGTQVSGATVHVPDPSLLPVHDVPVVRPRIDLTGDPGPGEVASVVAAAVAERSDEPALAHRLALAVHWAGSPAHRRLRAVAEGIQRGLDAQRSPFAGTPRQDGLLIVAVDADLAASIGRILVSELGWQGPSLLCLDGLDVREMDFLDVGRPAPGGACPVVVKSLIFANRTDEPAAVPDAR